jgi:hypothetical protein
MQVGVKEQVLAPGVKHGEEADAGSPMSGIGRNLQQRLGHGAKQQSVKAALILQRQGSEFFGHGKHHMTIRHGEQLLRPFRQPAVAGGGLALGTTAVATRVVSDAAMRAMIALLDVTAQSGCATDADILERLALLRRDGVTPALQEPLSVTAKDLGHFQV